MTPEHGARSADAVWREGKNDMPVERIPMTHGGVVRLRDRLKVLKTVEKPQNIKDIEEARAHGDLSENAEYHAAKEKQGQIDGEIKHLEDVLSRVEVIDIAKLSGDAVVFGATVDLEDDTGHKFTYTIVGQYETDIQKNRISITSPIARGLIGHEVGDDVKIQTPRGVREFEITDVRFIPIAAD